jgi:hypothetical protein
VPVGYITPPLYNSRTSGANLTFTVQVPYSSFFEIGSCKLADTYCVGATSILVYDTFTETTVKQVTSGDYPGCGTCSYLNFTNTGNYRRHLLSGTTNFTVVLSCATLADCIQQSQYEVINSPPPPSPLPPSPYPPNPPPHPPGFCNCVI